MHLWVRAEQRRNEERVGLLPEGARLLIAQGYQVTVEESATRIVDIAQYERVGCDIQPENTWVDAPEDAVIFGLKELPDDGRPLVHRHIMFGHAYKGQYLGQKLLARFKAGGGVLLDLEYLLDEQSRRVAAFGYWAGYVGAGIGLMAWSAAQRGDVCGPVERFHDRQAFLELLAEQFAQRVRKPRALIIGALGRVGRGASDLLTEMGCEVTRWDMAETAKAGPFPEILAHDIFVNAILAGPDVSPFVTKECLDRPRKLRVIADVACDPDSNYNPIAVYDRATDWPTPVHRVCQDPVLDVMAIDNLPSLLPKESSTDFATQLLPSLLRLSDNEAGVWMRANEIFQRHISEL